MFGDLLSAGSVNTKQDFIKQNPNTAQALTNAIVCGLKWLQKASPEDVAKVIPSEYLLGDKAVYFAAFERSREGYSKDGLISPTGAAALYKILRSFDPAVTVRMGRKWILRRPTTIGLWSALYRGGRSRERFGWIATSPALMAGQSRGAHKDWSPGSLSSIQTRGNRSSSST